MVAPLADGICDNVLHFTTSNHVEKFWGRVEGRDSESSRLDEKDCLKKRSRLGLAGLGWGLHESLDKAEPSAKPIRTV